MTDDDRIADMMLTWEEARERGRTVTAEELCRDCPELLDIVKARISLLERADWLRPPTSTPTAPRILGGRYSLEKLIGEGGYGQVWRAYDSTLQRHVAVKIPKSSRVVRHDQIDQFLTEARRVARLQHPGIVRVIDVQAEGSAYYIVTDLIDGTNLAERLRQGKPSIEETVRLVSHLARVLDYAHSQGIIHRDVKPANVLIDRDGVPHLCDFGIAATQQELLGGNDRRATLAYASPEQLEGKPMDGRSDLWSLGVVLYEMLTGRLPFHDDNPVRVKELICESPARPLSGLPDPIGVVCLRCLSKRPGQRFSTGKELATALETAVKPRSLGRWFFTAAAACLLGVSFVMYRTLETRTSPVEPTVQPTPTDPPQEQASVHFSPEEGKVNILARSVAKIFYSFDKSSWEPAEELYVGPNPLVTSKIVAVGQVNYKTFENHRNNGQIFLKFTDDEGRESRVYEEPFAPEQVLSLPRQEAAIKEQVAEIRERVKKSDQKVAQIIKMTNSRELDLSGQMITTENFKSISNLFLLRSLIMIGAEFDEEDLGFLAGLSALVEVSLAKTKITDAALSQLQRVDNLQEIDLSDTGITDVGLKALEELGGLKSIKLTGTLVTNTGVERFKRRLPNCKVTR